jgi:ParB-like chromosome segregation protein Spo0J
MSISSSLQKAAKLQEKIEGLRKQLDDLLSKARRELANVPAPVIPAALRAPVPKAAKTAKPVKGMKTLENPKRNGPQSKKQAVKKTPAVRADREDKGRARSSLAGRKRAASPSGPLAPAVVKVLKANGKPMRVAEILAGLLKNGYTFSSPEPKKNLAARIYRLSGVKQVAGGLFAQG